MTIPYPGPWLVAAGQAPALTLDGAAVPVQAECLGTVVPGFDRCNIASVTIPQGTTPGFRTVAGESASGCRGATQVKLAPRPAIASIAPSMVCANDPAGQMVVTGSGFIQAIPYAEDTLLQIDGEGCPVVYPGELPTCGELVVSAYHRLAPGVHQLVLRNLTQPDAFSASDGAIQLTLPSDLPTGEAAPATLADFRGQLGEVRIRGAWTDGTSEAVLDNFAIELAH